jgi:hypothetical protein
MLPTSHDRRRLREGTAKNEEILVPDARALLTPAQMVERKLVSLLKNASLPVSHLQTAQRRGPR